MNNPLVIFLRFQNTWLKFSDPSEIIITHTVDQVSKKLKDLDTCLGNGKYIAGFISYEAAPGLDSALTAKSDSGFPLLVFGVFNKPEILESLPEADDDFEISSWQPSQSEAFYNGNVAKIKDYIAKGDTYQVNYTMRMAAEYKGSSFAMFKQLVENQKAAYSSFIEYDKFRICSVSPELFFSLDREELISRPMKGTTSRGLTYQQDKLQKESLYSSQKDRAENLMIVDMIRNDMGKICRAGSVTVSSLFNTERYPTIWQMTSAVRGKTNAGFSEIIHALFPCASITGAPKARTMAIINELEQTPRHIYTGSIGYFSPQRHAQFNVAIRSVLLDSSLSKAEYGVGSGIVWDSVDENEYDECLLKTRVLTQEKIDFNLLETLLAEKDGIFLLEYHLQRLKNSAEYFNYLFNENDIRSALENISKENDGLLKLRLLVSENGNFTIEHQPLDKQKNKELKVCLAKDAINSQDLFLYHKTTHRHVYQPAINQAKLQKVDDVILFNEKEELTESTIANIVIEKDGQFYTPEQKCGLLNGTFRQYMIDQKKLKEKVLFINDLQSADQIFLINSIKKWQRAYLK